jgi:hypothetical protein
MPKQKGARKVSKAEMVRFMNWLHDKKPCAEDEVYRCPKWVVPGIKGGMCHDCINQIHAAIIRLIKEA